VDLKGLHLADLRHEAASRYDELDVPTAQISKLLRHPNLSTTTRYVNPTKKALRRAVDKIEERNRRLANSLQKGKTAKVNSDETAENSPPLSLA
jgi:integrase